MAYYLGIDGGGSKTTCVVGDESRILATATVGPSNITRVGEARARESLHESISQACAAAQIETGQVQCTCAGMSGAGQQETASVVQKIIAEFIPEKILVVGDMEIALEAALDDGPGVIVIAGTGSIVYGRDAQGRTARAGGWGFAISDEGSAHWIGRTAVASLFRRADEIGDDPVAESYPLFEEIKRVWRVETFGQLASMVNAHPDLAALLPAILAAAVAGDELSKQVLRQAGGELAQLAHVVVRRLFAAEKDSVRLGLIGGVFRHASLVREVFTDSIRRLDPRVQVGQQVVDPVIGALQIARSVGGRN